jgi:hypothetical protein
LEKNRESKEFNSQLINKDVYEKLHAKLVSRVWTRSEERKFQFAPEADNGYESLTNFRFATKFLRRKHKGRPGADMRTGTLPNESYPYSPENSKSQRFKGGSNPAWTLDSFLSRDRSPQNFYKTALTAPHPQPPTPTKTAQILKKITKFSPHPPPTPPPKIPFKPYSTQSPSPPNLQIFESKVQSQRLKKNLNLETKNLENFRRSLLNFKREHEPVIDQYITPLNYELVGNIFTDNPKPRDILIPKAAWMTEVSLEDYFGSGEGDG